MYKPWVLMLAAPILMSTSLAAWAAPCPFPMVQECRRAPQDRPPAAPSQCRCVNPPGSPTWGGKAEIHKKNVPTVRPNRVPSNN